MTMLHVNLSIAISVIISFKAVNSYWPTQFNTQITRFTRNLMFELLFSYCKLTQSQINVASNRKWTSTDAKTFHLNINFISDLGYFFADHYNRSSINTGPYWSILVIKAFPIISGQCGPVITSLLLLVIYTPSGAADQ